MCVPLFGAITSPSCANMALKKTADNSQDSFGKEAAATVKRDFYVNDLLKSQNTEESGIDLVQNVREMCASGGFKLTKFISKHQKSPENNSDKKSC